jgi:hypothetical protein
MKSDMQTIFDNVRKRFKNVPLLPSVGNNDVVVHNNVPCDDINANIYYSDLFGIWFP